MEKCRPGRCERLDLVDRLVQLERWVQDLQSGMYINCVYCGHRYGPKDEVPESMADVLKEHIEQCESHPLAAANKKIAQLEKKLAAAKRANFK